MKPMPVTYVWRFVDVAAGRTVMAMVPRDGFQEKIATRQFGEAGSEHTLEPTSMRNMASHRQYMVELREVYNNLPEDRAKEYPTFEFFRKRLLIAAGHCRQRHRAFANHKQAVNASLYASELLEDDEFAVVTVEDNIVVVRWPKSQDLSSMKKDEFEQSKRDVLELARSMIGVSAGDLRRNAGRSA